MYKGYQVKKVAKERPVEIDQAIDGLQITTRNNVVVYGLKMVDVAARSPKTGLLLYGCRDRYSVQSRYHCFPLKLAMQRETKAVLEQFRRNIVAMKKLTE
jgi:hypothetical protein